MGDYLARSVAIGAGGTNSKEPLGSRNLSPAATGLADFFFIAGFHTRTVTVGTCLKPWNVNFHILTKGSLKEADL
jgi:hypothetical protein